MLTAVLLAACATVLSAQMPGTAVVAEVHQFVDGFNKGDMKVMAASCAEQASFLDEFPPHEWHGGGGLCEVG